MRIARPTFHLLLGDVYASMGQLDRGIAEHAKARALNPNNPDIKSESAGYLAFAGRVDEAIELLQDAMRLNPFLPRLVSLGRCPACITRRAITMPSSMRSKRMTEPPVDPLLFLAASYAQLGRLTEARATVKRVLALDPKATVAQVRRPAAVQGPRRSGALQGRRTQARPARRRADQLSAAKARRLRCARP